MILNASMSPSFTLRIRGSTCCEIFAYDDHSWEEVHRHARIDVKNYWFVYILMGMPVACKHKFLYSKTAAELI